MKNWGSEKKNSWFSCSIRSLGQGHVGLAPPWWAWKCDREQQEDRPGGADPPAAHHTSASRSFASETVLLPLLVSSIVKWGYAAPSWNCATRLLLHYRVKCSGRGQFVYNLSFPSSSCLILRTSHNFFDLVLSSGFSLADSACLMRLFLGMNTRREKQCVLFLLLGS